MREATIKFSIDGKPYEFKVIHNMPDDLGLNIEGAFHNWASRTKKYTVESFCDYIKSKGLHFCEPVTTKK